jgi:hypothetical protein
MLTQEDIEFKRTLLDKSKSLQERLMKSFDDMTIASTGLIVSLIGTPISAFLAYSNYKADHNLLGTAFALASLAFAGTTIKYIARFRNALRESGACRQEQARFYKQEDELFNKLQEEDYQKNPLV